MFFSGNLVAAAGNVNVVNLIGEKAATTYVDTEVGAKQDSLSGGSIISPTTQLAILDGTVVRAIARDDNLTMTLVSDRIHLGVNTTNVALQTDVTSAVSGLASTGYVDTAVGAKQGTLSTPSISNPTTQSQILEGARRQFDDERCLESD